MKPRFARRAGLLALAALLVSLAGAALGAEVPRLTKEELRGLLGDPGVAIIDTRLGRDWASSDVKIPGAVREDPGAVSSWAGKYAQDQTIVLYCA